LVSKVNLAARILFFQSSALLVSGRLCSRSIGPFFVFVTFLYCETSAWDGPCADTPTPPMPPWAPCRSYCQTYGPRLFNFLPFTFYPLPPHPNSAVDSKGPHCPPPMKLSGRILTNKIVLPPSAGLATLQATPLFLFFLRPSVDHPWVLADQWS